MYYPIYKDLTELNKTQKSIMVFIEQWVHTEKTPIPQKEIVIYMKEHGVKESTTVLALSGMLETRYIRRAVMISNKTSYVQCRRVST